MAGRSPISAIFGQNSSRGAGLLHGLSLLAVAIVAQAVWGMARTPLSGSHTRLDRCRSLLDDLGERSVSYADRRHHAWWTCRTHILSDGCAAFSEPYARARLAARRHHRTRSRLALKYSFVLTTNQIVTKVDVRALYSTRKPMLAASITKVANQPTIIIERGKMSLPMICGLVAIKSMVAITGAAKRPFSTALQ